MCGQNLSFFRNLELVCNYSCLVSAGPEVFTCISPVLPDLDFTFVTSQVMLVLCCLYEILCLGYNLLGAMAVHMVHDLVTVLVWVKRLALDFFENTRMDTHCDNIAELFFQVSG